MFPGEPYNYLNSSDLALYEEDYLARLERATEEALEYMDSLTEVARLIDSAGTIEKAAHLQAINDISGLAFDKLQLEFLRNIILTTEFNYDPFVERTHEALRMHRNELFETETRYPGRITVHINMRLLGDSNDWYNAVVGARAVLGIGRIPDPQVRSHIWAEKIYGVAREGKSVESTHTGEDITDRYLEKYPTTIETRLSFIDEDKAPWWYIINYGSSDLVFGEAEEAGTPYPVIEPTNFVELTARMIEWAFSDIYESVLARMTATYQEDLEDDYTPSYDWHTYGMSDSTEDLLEDLADQLDPYLAKAIETGQLETPTNKTIEYVKQDETTWELYVTSKGNLGRRYSLSRNRGG